MAHRKDKNPAQKTFKEKLVEFLTQNMYESAIRIKKPMNHEVLEALVNEAVGAWIEKYYEEKRAAPRRQVQATEGADSYFEKQKALMTKVGTGLWRLRKRMLKPGTEEPLEEMKRPYRQLESVWDAIHEAGYKIIDHTNMPYNEGLELRVIHYGQREGIDREIISETVVPSILFEGTRIQEGEVYVDYPAEKGPAGAKTETTPGPQPDPGDKLS
jgi:hypothetical protein